MTYGTIKVDTVTFTNAGVDKSVTLSGLVQNPVFSGNVTVTGTLSGVTVTGTTANFTSGNFTNISGGTHTITSGVFAAGSAASPSITFTGDLNTGIYSPGADQVAISTGGSRRLLVSNVQIQADTLFSVAMGGVGFQTIFRNGANEDNYITHGASGFTLFRNHNGSEYMRLDSSGRLGIGTSSPSAPLHVRLDQGGTTSVIVQNSSVSANAYTQFRAIGDAGQGSFGYAGSGSGASGIYESDYVYLASESGASGLNVGATSGPLRFFSQNSESGRFDTSGRLGIGTTSPGSYSSDASNLVIAGTGLVGATISSTNSGNSNIYFADGTTGNEAYRGVVSYAHSTDSMQLWTASTERIRIDSSGRVGIGTSSPSNTLHVVGTGLIADANNGINLTLTKTGGFGSALQLQNTSGLSSDLIRILDSSNNIISQIQPATNGINFASGRVGIGTTPAQQLHSYSSTGSTVAGSFETNQSESYITFKASGTSTLTSCRIGVSGENILFLNNGANERARIDSSGRLLVGTSTSVLETVAIKGDGGGLQVCRLNSGFVTTGQALGSIGFKGTTSANSNAAAEVLIQAVAEENFSGTAAGSRLEFHTKTNGVGPGSSPTPRMTITNAGLVGVGTSSPPSLCSIAGPGVTGTVGRLLQIYPSSATGAGSGSEIWLGWNPSNLNAGGGVTIGSVYTGSGTDVVFSTPVNASSSPSERMRIDSSGRVGIGTSNPGYRLEVAGTSGSAVVGLLETGVRSWGIRAGGSATNIFDIADFTAGASRLTIDSSGRVGIGTTSPASKLHVNLGTNENIVFTTGGGGDQRITAFNDAANATVQLSLQGSPLLFRSTGGVEVGRWDSSGRLLVGTSSARSNFYNVGSSAGLQLEGVGASRRLSITGADEAGVVILARQRSGSTGGNTILANGDTIGVVTFQGNDGSDFVEAASIIAFVDGAPGADDMPGRLVFSTTADGASSPTERMRIRSDGNVGLGTAGSNNIRLHIKGSDATSSNNCLYAADSADTVLFYVRNDGVVNTGTSTNSPYNFTTGSAANVFVTSGGTLQRSTSSIKYKTDVRDAEHGLSDLLNLRPVTYKGKSETDEGKIFGGLIAEEVHDAGLGEFVQYAEDGSPDALAYGNMVSLCIKAIQEQQAMIAELQAKVAALESA